MGAEDGAGIGNGGLRGGHVDELRSGGALGVVGLFELRVLECLLSVRQGCQLLMATSPPEFTVRQEMLTIERCDADLSAGFECGEGLRGLLSREYRHRDVLA